MKEPQSPWEETAEEVRRRIEAAKVTNVGWTGTVIGILLALLALVGLSFLRFPSTW